MNVILEILGLFFYLFYCYLEAIFRKIVPHSRKSVEGQTVLVTGAGHGIGRELSLEFCRLGARLVLWDIHKANVDSVADEIRKLDGSVHSYLCDVSKPDDIKRVSERVRREVGDVDILVNNAGILNGGELMKLDDKDIQRTMDINTMAHFWTLREFLPAMLQKNAGHIITIASMSAKSGTALLVDYSASKFAVFGMTEALSEELKCLEKDGVKTTIVCPMFVNTGLTKYPRGRLGKVLSPEEVALTAIDGALRGDEVVMVPRSMELNTRIGMLFPRKFNQYMKKVMDFGIDPQYKSSGSKQD